MTGPVERVPLTDDKLVELEKFARDNGNILALGFIAELRASRAREQELQQRIDGVLAMCEAADTDRTPRLWYVQLLDPRTVRAALTGTET